MSSTKVNGKALMVFAFLTGAAITWLLFHLGVLTQCMGCHVDVDNIFLGRQVKLHCTPHDTIGFGQLQIYVID